MPGAPFAALLAAFALFSPDEARAQAAVCTPTQTVEAPEGPGADVTSPRGEANPFTRYRTVIVCANTTAMTGAADYRHLHYNQGPGTTGDPNPEDRDTSLENNNPDNDVSLTVGSGVVFTADGGVDMRVLPVDAAIALWRGGAKRVIVEDGAVVNLERTPGGGGTYPHWLDSLGNLAGIYAVSETGKGGVTLRHHGVIEIDIDVTGFYGSAYDANVGAGIIVRVTDEDSGATRADEDILVELGATGVIRQRAGSEGLGGVFTQNYAEDGDITINLAEGSLIDLTAGGGSTGVVGHIDVSGNNAGVQTGDVVINAAGIIRNAVKTRTLSQRQGVSLRPINDGHGAIRVTSSGTVESWQALAIMASANSGDSEQHDDPATKEIEGHLIDVTAGKVHTRGGSAILTESVSEDAAFTIRVGEGATVRGWRRS